MFHVYSALAPDWKAVITEGALSGVANILFTPDSRHLIVVAEHNIRLTVWSFCTKGVRYVRFPKLLSFDKTGQFLAMVEIGSEVADGGSAGEAVSIFDLAGDWAEVARFFANIDSSAVYVTRMMWNPDSTYIALYSSLQNVVQIRDPRGVMVFITSSGGNFAWSPCGSLFLTSGTEDNLAVFNSLNWSKISNLRHADTIDSELRTMNCVVLEEKIVESEDIDVNLVSRLLNRHKTSYEKIIVRPLAFSRLESVDAKRRPRVSLDFSFSPDGLYVASKHERLPAVIWIWDMQKTQLASVLIHRDRVVSFTWEPSNSAHDGSSRLLILTKGARNICVWTKRGAAVLQMPPDVSSEFSHAQAIWNPKGSACVIAGKESFICCKL